MEPRLLGYEIDADAQEYQSMLLMAMKGPMHQKSTVQVRQGECAEAETKRGSKFPRETGCCLCFRSPARTLAISLPVVCMLLARGRCLLVAARPGTQSPPAM